MDSAIPLPDFDFDDMTLMSFTGAIPSSPAIIHTGATDVVEAFGFSVLSPRPLKSTINSSLFSALSGDSQSIVAVKVSSNKSRLFAEFENRSLLPESPYLVASHDIYELGPMAMIEMELCENGDIQGKQLNEEDSWRLARDIASGLDTIHSSGFMHLDVSPMNILVGNDCFKLCDFGTLLEDGQFSAGCEGAGPYASPEVLAFPRQNVTYATDIFSLGVVLLEAASGFYAPRGGDRRYEQLRNGEIKLGGSEYKCDFHTEFINMVNAMIDPDPSRRPDAYTVASSADYVLRHAVFT